MTPWVLRLLIANTLIFFITAPILGQVVRDFSWVPALGLVRPWTLITYQFLHANFLHLLFNMIGLFFFGPRLEAKIGSRHFLGMYLVSGIVGGLLSVTTPWASIIGSSGAVFGVLLGFARYWPDERIYIWGVIPVRARIMVIGLAVISIWLGFSGTGGSIAHFAHLGGFVGGWIYLKLLERNSPAERFRREIEVAEVGSMPTSRDLERWRQVDAGLLHPLNREEFERMLMKAEAAGVRSLSAQERAFMKRMAND